MKLSHAFAAAAALLVLAAVPARAQHTGHDAPKVTKDSGGAHAHSTEHMSGWRELDAYHMAMMRAWHPAKERKDLAPARANADTMATLANAWAAASVPAACDTPAARAHVAAVRDGSVAFAGLVRQARGDDELLAALRALHDRFEVVNRGCRAH